VCRGQDYATSCLIWPDWVGETLEYFKCDPPTIYQTLQRPCSKGSTKSLWVGFYTRIVPGYIIEVLLNFGFLEEVSVHKESISSHELTSVLQNLLQITTFRLYIVEFQDTPIKPLEIIQLKLRTLLIQVYANYSRPTTLHNTVANIVKHSPDLVCLTVRGTSARKEWTTKLGDRIKHLSLYIKGTHPPISCKGLKCLVLEGSHAQRREPFEPCPCDLSYLTRLAIFGFSTEQQLSLMKAYNIGENLEFKHMDSNPGYPALSRTPKLKSLGSYHLGNDTPLHVCPALRTVRDNTLFYKEREGERLQSLGYVVMRSIDFLDMADWTNCDFC
jgi:hypothetical protein